MGSVLGVRLATRPPQPSGPPTPFEPWWLPIVQSTDRADDLPGYGLGLRRRL
jgi:hypothetical protein